MTGLSSIVMSPYLILLLICHLLSDYYFQSQKMADRKNRDKKVLGLHILYVALPLIVVSLCHLDLWWICLIILLTHAGIDGAKTMEINKLMGFYGGSILACRYHHYFGLLGSKK